LLQFLSKLAFSFFWEEFKKNLPQKIGGKKRVLGANMIKLFFFSAKICGG
jgi:hypothetical protein